MMNHFLGEEVFRRGLINYLQKHQNGNADRQDLFTSLTMEAHKADVLLQNDTVKHIMDTWTERAGFPLVTAAADYENKRLHITQVSTQVCVLCLVRSRNKRSGNKHYYYLEDSCLTFAFLCAIISKKNKGNRQ